MPPIAVGSQPSGSPSAAVFVAVEGQDGAPLLRIDVHQSDRGAFQETIVWKELVVVGYGDLVHLVSLRSHEVTSHSMSGYFGHLYPLEDYLLVADAGHLHCFDSKGAQLWRSDPLGIDGVVVEKVDRGTIEGEGEWDPPGDWRRFALWLSSGQPLVR